jgi:hypothetical protein
MLRLTGIFMLLLLDASRTVVHLNYNAFGRVEKPDTILFSRYVDIKPDKHHSQGGAIHG